MKILSTGAQTCFEDLPLEVNWSITLNCNYRCSYCFDYGKKHTPPLRNLSQHWNNSEMPLTISRP